MSAPATNRWRVSRLKFDAVLNARIGWHGLSTDDHRDVGDFLVTGTDFSDRSVNWDGCKRVDRQVFDRDPNIQLANGDLLVTKDGTIGKVAVVSGLGADQRATLNSGVFRVRVETNSLVPEFLYYLLRSALFDQFVDLAGGGSTIEHLYQRDFVNFKYPLPPLSTQKAIADYLDTETARIDALIEKKKRMIELLEETERSLVDAIFSDDLTDKRLRLARVARLQTGLTLDSKRESGHGAVSRPYLRVANVQADRLDLTEVKVVTVPRELAQRTALRPGDVLMTEGGDLDKLGRGTVWQGEIPDCLHQNHVFAVRPMASKLRPEFLAALTRTSDARRYFESTGTRSTNLASTNSVKVLDFRIPVPSLTEQQERLAHFDKRTAPSKKACARLTEQVNLLMEKRQALITAAVTGELEIPEAA